MEFGSKEEKRKKWEIQSSASLMDDMPSDESFFNALVQQSPDQKINTVDASSDDLASDERFFHALVEQSPAEKNNNKVDHCSNDILDHSSYTKKLEIDEVLDGEYCSEPAFLGKLGMEKKSQCEFQKDCHDNKKSGVSYDEAWLDELLLADFHQPRSLAAFITNFHIDQGTKKY